MDTSTSPLSEESGRGRPVTPGFLAAALWVPFATVVGVIVSWQVQGIHGDWVDRQQAACQRMPFPKAQHFAAWTGLALGISAVVVCVLLARQIRRRRGTRLADTKLGLLACTGAWLGALTIPVELFLLYATYSPDPSGSILGDCG
ncbi:hypothetical protein [Streptomyces huiliensis]|uniref:hypothetical protein n=1 Tax=Streptomyces huiliensis TaxID=2876027 RepID=UPI001CBD392F|nr:hypothetical protein [Streptomyces huiliensis]MBZ4319895.1 hypothetical protein [Streptomyces huiliensis]